MEYFILTFFLNVIMHLRYLFESLFKWEEERLEKYY